MILLTHCYPTSEYPISGIWLKRMFGTLNGLELAVVGKFSGWFRAWLKLRRSKKLIVACWLMPAGVLAFLSGRKYVLYCLGMDCFLIQRHAWLAWLLYPVVRRASAIVFCSDHSRDCFESRYEKFYPKMRVIRLPVVKGDL